MASECVVTPMTKTTFSVSTFIKELENIWNSEGRDVLVLNIDETGIWPHFTMTGTREGTPAIKGHFVEGGTSYWQIGDSGREVFTGDDRSCVDFITEIRTVVHVLVVTGCTEIRWINQAGLLINAMIAIEVGSRKILFGDTPAFWKSGLIKNSIVYPPYRSVS